MPIGPFKGIKQALIRAFALILLPREYVFICKQHHYVTVIEKANE